MTTQHQQDFAPQKEQTGEQPTEQKEQNSLTFEQLNLAKPILKALTKSGYTTPTPIQAGAIPHAIDGRDLLLSAQTGSGKTAAFVLPILHQLAQPKPAEKSSEFSQKSHNRHQKTAIKALILTPTRELAMQVQDNVRKYSSEMRGIFSVPLVGGAPYGGQIRALRKGVQIVIATPGRLIDHMNDGRVDLSELDTLILDEADRMLDMGFADDIKTILEAAPSKRQTVMSSATWDGAVGKIAESFTVNPERVSIKVESAHIDESVYFCDDFHHKNKILIELLGNPEINQAVIFTATKRSTEQLAESLTEAGLSARYLHGDLPQGKRNRIISDVKSGKCNFLIATDVAARGIDISAISHVVNYDLPRQVEDYVHRIGRCGRAGRTGVAMNLCSMDDRRQLGHINRYLNREMKEEVVVGLEPKRVAPSAKDKDGRREGRGRRGGGRGFGRGERAEFVTRSGRSSFGGHDRHEAYDRQGDRPDGRAGRDKQSHDKNGYGRSYDRQGDRPNRERQYRTERYERGESGRDERFAKPYQERFGDRDDRCTRQDRDYRQDKPKSFGCARENSREFGQRDNTYKGERAWRDDKRKGGKETAKFGGRDGMKKSYKKRAVEEMFFAKRQEKKAKRKFGEL
ncbi:DEAD/DEAH box helicase [Moraxella bovis]|uniref:DEAD/DEAH box helicase n=1 Tax=Moraxella bovis TaxID=476 RepID=UPI0022266012|nr:DEAD/DEAH box helicase [Moraxella bovis]UYZ81248.1 DEAD/DEAH box helicase [Moraxella bovis]UYZ89460.1 DEAD/DEAH box helicase [Moraxella bovis]UYZ95446.1 DEAD/DEAH box helicase [Moraxella bovis]UZA06189.1 DEAD/DEAH box helicase [Moraxella bovis]UZA11583.1 DEAD/DEAH box helicase [Moraxella bovis]